MESDIIKKTAEAPARVLDNTVRESKTIIRSVENRKELKKIRRFWHILGPGLTTGASDDDPAGIATYSQAGAKFGYNLLYISFITFPIMSIVQEMCARIGLVTKKGLAGNIKQYFPLPILYVSTALLFIANIFNIGANLGAMASSAQLLLPNISFPALVVIFTVLTLALQISFRYEKYSQILKWLSLVLLAYIVSAFLVDNIDWNFVLYKVFHPTFTPDKDHILMICAIFGTTVSPYLFFWQTAQEVEDKFANNKDEIKYEVNNKHLREMRYDVWFGMLFSNAVMFFIITTCSATLNLNNIMDINTAAQAAQALEPLAGKNSSLLFNIGILGTGLLSIPVLAGSASYAISESLGWSVGMGKKIRQAYAFYGIIIFSLILGLIINFLGLDPIKALIYSAIINGIISPLILIQILILANNDKVMGTFKNSKIYSVFGWIATSIMILVGIITIINLFMKYKLLYY